MRAPCFSEAMAQAYADPHCSSSSSSLLLLFKKQSPRIQSNRRDKCQTRRNVISSLLLLLLALPIASALFDPGFSEPDKESQDKATSKQGLASSKGSSLSLITPKGQPISLHPGCRRTTDLFDNVCHNPWSPFSISQSKTKGLTQSEIVICPLGENNKNEKERVFAITGTITLPESTYEDVEASSSSVITATLGDKQPDWPKPGDDGFWRQRDGELEWVPTEVRALLESDVTPANIPKVGASKEESTSTPDVAHVKEYDEWSASIGGEDSKTWLSFEQWKANFLAAEREQEKQKHAAGRKQKADKAKEKKNGAQAQASNGTEGAPEVQHSAVPSQEANPTLDSKANLANATASSDPHLPEEKKLPVDESAEEKQDNTQAEASTPQPTQPSVIKPDTLQDTGSIPAVGDPSSQLSTLKHRWNFASLDCAAVVHRANPSAKFTSSILSEKKDRYMLSPCPESGGDQQFVVVELCDEISVDTIVLANYEFFSRMFKRFRVKVSRNLNGGEGDWYDIGTFRARNVRGLQVFNTVPPTADSRFFRYVRIDFLEHYGSEYYCPISLLRVYGLTQMDDYIREEEEMRKQREVELTLEESENTDEEDDEVEQKATVTESVVTSTGGVETHTETAETPSSALSSTSSMDSTSSSATVAVASTTEQPAEAKLTSKQSADSTSHIATSNTREKEASEKAKETVTIPLEGSGAALPKPVIDVAKTYENNTADHISNQVCNASSTNTTAPLYKAEVNSSDITFHRAANESVPVAMPANTTATASPIGEAKERAINATNSASGSGSAAQPSTSDSGKSTGGNSPPHQGGSESIYRTITKRLNMLEMNATLSLQYMEHSRQQLREVFGRMERNQREKIAEMLQELNSSNWRQIESLKRRQQVDLQQAIFEFDKHRQQTDEERRALLAQVHILSNEVILEKRFGIAQLILLLGLFVFMAMTRGSKAIPLVHHGLARISKNSPLNLDYSISSPSATIRGSGSPGNLARFSNYSSKPRSSSPERIRQQLSRQQLPSTPRTGKQHRGAERAVRLRGGSHIKSASKKSKLNGLLSPSPLHFRNSISSSTTSDQHNYRPSFNSQDEALAISSPSIRPNIEVRPVELPSKVDVKTPVQRFAPRARSLFDRESTPTNLMEAQQVNEAIPAFSSSATLTMDESFNSDWGTERSDDDNEPHTCHGWNSEKKAIEAVSTSTINSPPIFQIPQPSSISNPVHRIQESDAEEDSPKWNSVKSRRSLKRPGSSGSWQANGQSRVYTPTNHTNTASSPRRSFSPFHKNAEIEIN